MSHKGSPDDAGEKIIARVISTVAVVFALLHLYAAISPGPSNWGVHFSGYFPFPLNAAIPLLMLLFLFPGIQEKTAGVFASIASFISRRRNPSRAGFFLALLAIAAGVFWIAREQLYLLGDGFIVVRRIALIGGIDDIAGIFKHEPLPGYFMWRFWQIFEAAGIVVTDEFPTQLVSILSGTGSILILGLLVRRLASDATDRVLLFAFIFTGGATQLFFGYMENYTFLYFAILLFVHLSVLHLEGDAPLASPMAGLGLLLVTHFASLIFLPPALFLAWRCASARKWRELAAGTASFLVVSSSLLMLCGYSIPGFFYLLMNSEKHMMPLMEITSRYQAYTLFSGAHLLNLANLHLLLSPFALVLFLIAGTGRRRTMLMQSPTLLFLAVGGICGLLFTTAVNPDLGMSRDWDLLAPFLLIVLIAGGLFGIRFIERPAKRRRLMALVASVMILHSGSWIALNADEDRSLDRFLGLADERYWGPSSLTSAYEVLGYLYFERGDLRQTALYLEKYISKDDTYLPVWERLGDVYRYLRDEENELRANESAIRLGSRNTAAFINAGLAHSSRGNLSRAMELTQGALDIDPGSVEANNNYGIFILRGGGRCEDAVPYFLRSISSDPSFPGPYFNAARCYTYMGEGGKAVQYAEAYLRIDPRGVYAADAQNIVTSGGR